VEARLGRAKKPILDNGPASSTAQQTTPCRNLRAERENRKKRIARSGYRLRWRILARMRRFLRPILRRPLPVFLVPTWDSVGLEIIEVATQGAQWEPLSVSDHADGRQGDIVRGEAGSRVKFSTIRRQSENANSKNSRIGRQSPFSRPLLRISELSLTAPHSHNHTSLRRGEVGRGPGFCMAPRNIT
jgi:hypothetical protein